MTDPLTQVFEAAVAGEPHVIVKDGKPVAVLLAYEEWEHMTDTIEKLST